MFFYTFYTTIPPIWTKRTSISFLFCFLLSDVNECSVNLCQNSGTCVNTFGGYYCKCPLGWSGTHCEIGKTNVIILMKYMSCFVWFLKLSFSCIKLTLLWKEIYLSLILNRTLSPLMVWVLTQLLARCTTLCDQVCQWLETGRWFSRALQFPLPIKLTATI